MKNEQITEFTKPTGFQGVHFWLCFPIRGAAPAGREPGQHRGLRSPAPGRSDSAVKGLLSLQTSLSLLCAAWEVRSGFCGLRLWGGLQSEKSCKAAGERYETLSPETGCRAVLRRSSVLSYRWQIGVLLSVSEQQGRSWWPEHPVVTLNFT